MLRCSNHLRHYISDFAFQTIVQLAAVAVAIKRCADHPLVLPLLLLFACAPGGACFVAAMQILLRLPTAVHLFAGLTWDELVLVINEQPWPEGSTTGRCGSQVRGLSFNHNFALDPNLCSGA